MSSCSDVQTCIGSFLRAPEEALSVVDLESLCSAAKLLLERAEARLVAAQQEPAVPAEEEPAEEERRKEAGRVLFKEKRYAEAIEEWIAADKKATNRDAKLLSNLAAAYLALDKFVGAAMYAAEATDVDPTWWKGHYYRGQALLRMTKNKPPSLAMGERLEQATKAFKRCRASSSLPPDRIPEIEHQIDAANKIGLNMTTVCQQQ